MLAARPREPAIVTAMAAPPRPAPLTRLPYFAALLFVAVGAAGFAIVFRWLLREAFELTRGSSNVVAMITSLPWWARLLVPALGGLLAGSVALAVSRATRGQGVGDVMEAVALGRGHLSMRTTLLKSLGSWLAIVSGGSIGREGPLIQFGGTLGSTVARLFRVDDTRARSLMAAGTAAGFAAAYNTPLAAVLFTLEVVTGVVALDAIVSTLAATALATAITRAVIGGGPIYQQRGFALASQGELVAHVVLGILGALTAQAFMRLLSGTETFFVRVKLPQPWRAGLGGLLVGGLATVLPQVTGNGYEPLNAMLDGTVPLTLVLWLLLAKAVATTASVSSGSPGGVFTPTLLLGAAVGMAFQAVLASLFGPSAIGSPGAYALVGMAATTAAMTHAPMMAAVLVFELSGDYAIVVPLLLATAVATVLSRAMRADSLYGAELRRRGVAWEVTLDGRQSVDVKTR
jgi:CIC family chloride channel protein